MKKTENIKLITNYLSYLREVSRKIISDSGFVDALVNNVSSPLEINMDEFKKLYEINDKGYNEIKSIYKNLQLANNTEKRLFAGVGTIIGKVKAKSKLVVAPLLYLQCEIEIDKTELYPSYLIKTVDDSLTLNYDLITSLLNINDEGKADNENIEVIELINQLTIKSQNNPILNIKKLQKDTLSLLLNDTKILKQLDLVDIRNAEYYDLTRKYISLTNIKKRKSLLDNINIFENQLQYYDLNYLFINTIPNQLSTYYALDSMVKQLESNNYIKNEVVEKLLSNSLSNEDISIESDNNEKIILDIIEKYLPLNLSPSQKQGIINAWNNEISYIQGPPGTGKSYTISAIILSAIIMKKKVLVVSQKTAALEVLNEKVNPFIIAQNEITGLIYYNSNNRRFIKNQLENIVKINQVKSNVSDEVNRLKQQINKDEVELDLIIKEINTISNKINNYLENIRKYEIDCERLNTEITRFDETIFELPKHYKFKYINKHNYSEIKLKIDFIYKNNEQNSLSSLLYLTKIKRYFENQYKIESNSIKKKNIESFVKMFVNLNALYSELKNHENNLNIDINIYRKNITHLKDDKEKIQKRILRNKYKSNLLEKILDNNTTKQITKLSSMLINANSSKILIKMDQIEYSYILETLPLWSVEIRNLGQLFPLKNEMFDLIIVDESSQVNLAEIIPVFYRGSKICILGDHKQLSLNSSGLNFAISTKYDELMWNNYNNNTLYSDAITRNLVVTNSSILDFIRSKENKIDVKEVMLEEHFRSLPQLAKYTNKMFYSDEDNPDGKLKIMTETPANLNINCFSAIRVEGLRESNSKVIEAEALKVVEIINSLIIRKDSNNTNIINPTHLSDKLTIGVVSFISDQCNRIELLLREHFDDDIWDKYKLFVGTPEKFQGNEKDVIIISLALDENSLGFAHYKEPKRFNVATSRAKYFTYFVYSKFSSKFDNIVSYLKSMGIDLNASDIVNEQLKITSNNLNKFNLEKCDSEFEKKVYQYLKDYVKLKTNEKIEIFNQIETCGQKRLDFVLINESNNKFVALEVDGRFHYVQNSEHITYSKKHNERLDILLRAGWKIVNTPYNKWYQHGWLSDTNNPTFKNELNRIYTELDKHLL